MSISLVIVEDLAEVREGLRQFISLNPEFKMLATFETAEEAMCQLPALVPDIVITDICPHDNRTKVSARGNQERY